MVNLRAEDIRQVLAEAHERSLTDDVLVVDSLIETYVALLEEDSCPRTYLAVLTVLLTARSMFGYSDLDVLEIKRGDTPRGYSAPSIGSQVAVFAKDHSIDLRASSQQPLNNQPFTYKNRIEKDMGAKSSSAHHFQSFFSCATLVNSFSSEEASLSLAWLFRRRKMALVAPKSYAVSNLERETLLNSIEEIASFVSQHSDLGRVGQAFASACFEILYGEEVVRQGNAQDPDASKVGDVHVQMPESETTWLWVEVKQQPVQTGALVGFLEKVEQSGGRRIVYLAFKNTNYQSSIDVDKVKRLASKSGMQVKIFQSPIDFLLYAIEISPGSFGEQLQNLLEAFDRRLVEADVSEKTLGVFRDMAKSLLAS